MAPNFVFPQNLRALEEEPEENRLHAQNPIDIATLRPSQLEEFVKGVSFDLSDKELFCIEEPDVFDRVYSLIRAFSILTPSCKFNLVESLRSNFCVLLPNVDSLSRVSQGEQDHDEDAPVLDRVTSYRNAFKIYTFFLSNVVLAEESNTSSGNNAKVTATSRKKPLINSWNWESQRGRILNLIANSLEINLVLIFGSSDLDENYLSFVVKNAFSLFENATLLKHFDTKDALCRIIGACATKYHYTAQSCASIIHLVHKYEFVVTHMADAVAGAEKKYADGTLASSIIREIGRTNPKSYVKDPVGAENVGRFLVELSDRLPKLFSTNIGLLVPHFGGESYKIRNALVGVLGKLIAKAFKDIEGEVSSKSVRLRTKQAMLEILLERCRDVSAYTRSRVLQVWAELCEEHLVSIGLWNEVAAVAAGRLEDKSAIVRKSALNLLIIMLQHNPFGPQLRVASFEATLEQYKKKLNELEPGIESESVEDGLPSENGTCDGDGSIDSVNDEGEAKEQLDSSTDSALAHVEAGIAHEDSSVPDVGNLEQTRALVASLEAGLRFSKCVSATMPILVQLMASSSATDVENTIHLLMRCKQFQIDGAEACLRKMLPLVFSQDKSIYEAVENAFITIYVRKSPVETGKNLLNLVIYSNIGDQAALECIIGALVSKGDISTSMISALWDFFCFNVSGITAEQSRGALSVLCMAAKSSTGILGSHLQDIIDIGFGRWAKVEPLLARTACIAIQRLSEEHKKKLLLNNGSRVFGIIESLITGFWLPDNIWYATADKAISALYTIHPTPETLAADLVKKSFGSVFNCSEGDELQNDIDNGIRTVLTTVHASKLSRYLFVISHVISFSGLGPDCGFCFIVKGHINEMALRVEDDDERISNLAKLFFHELSKKGSNPIYNLLPDILGKLANQNLKKESFCNIIQFLIGSIKKDKQMEALVEKLCNRFSGVTDVRQWEYISYCLSQLAFTEKGMKKLIELFKTYEPALSEDSVMDHFRNIINKGKKFAKPELKVCIEEFEEKLNKFHMVRKDQEVTARSAQIHQQKICGKECFVVARNAGEDSADSYSSFFLVFSASNIRLNHLYVLPERIYLFLLFYTTDVEVVGPSMERRTRSLNDASNSELVAPEEYLGSSSEVAESEPDGIEVKSPDVNVKGAFKSSDKKNIMKNQNSDISAITRRNLRSKRR
ncbi:LOW QUALITY PROTEIN: Cnd1 domain-containing protein/Cnd1_N domain-containing protein [Cephalotus follicularis]|uniref:Condensin-1 complex subunit CAP-D2 n=1 Tax=Cephalotus follicularis TaxID=3775 RepID=A0A1Q3ATZ7_CEPFO|nr:LOW QUALITY PROTEIN: Cnd1 domain-containing protein/Cnd1_N domain-containing protein [Cephalotus follicularis]